MFLWGTLLTLGLWWSGLHHATVAVAIQPSVSVTPLSTHISNNQQEHLFPIHMAVSVPTLPSNDFLPFELAIVLDVSGSMAGLALHRAKEAIKTLIENMSHDDIIHLVKYAEEAEVVWESGVLADKKRMLSMLESLEAEGGTNLYDGVIRGHEILKERILDRPAITDRRVFLFSDGHANVGITSQEEITKTISQMFETSRIITSAFGVGNGFSRELMTAIAEFGKGDFFYISEPDQMEKVLNVARKDIQSVIGYDAKLYLRTDNLDNSMSEQYFKVALSSSAQNEYDDNVIAVKDLRSSDTKRYTVELEIDVNIPKSDYKDDMKVQLLKWKLEYIEKATGSEKTLEGTVEVYITNDEEKEFKFIDKNVRVQDYLANLRRHHADVVDHLENNDVASAEKAKKSLEEKTQVLKTFIEENDAEVSEESKTVADIQVGRYDKAVFSSGFEDKKKFIYENMMIQVLNQDGSTAHDEL